ncbi:hypothetical protein TU79_14415 [Pseudomonas trivialis]|uniref:Uncharacterized protein n=1 Tax=Pseudomonas trivialis TaxID=200450 RepID=A0A0R2ZFP6_9PSED|nr:hypothetical protein TU79_14415 [Pseudomonas trivialis]
MLQFGNGRRGLRSGGAQVGGRVRRIGTPLAVATQVDHAAIGKLQRHGASGAGIDLLPGEQTITFYKQATNPFRGYREHLTDNAFDDRNAAHKKSPKYRSGGHPSRRPALPLVPIQ